MREQEFERLYEQHAQGRLGFLTYRTGDRALAEDVLADTFERVLKARRWVDYGRASKKTWLYAIALNCLRDHQRRRAAESRALERAGETRQAPDEDPPFEALEERDSLYRALQTLSEEEREAIALRYGADLTSPEIAELTKERLTTIEGRVYRALRKLRENLT
jgi:RNA polymerase sigma factor (sigma-70 family)